MSFGTPSILKRSGAKLRFFDFDIVISQNTSSFNLSSELIQLGFSGSNTVPVKGKVTINSGITVSGKQTSKLKKDGGVSFMIDKFDQRSIITIENNGTIIGSGGQGGFKTTYPECDGGRGGHALVTFSKINLKNNGLIIGGGGGGGGCCGGGGGGAGIPAGNGGTGQEGCSNFAGTTKCWGAALGTSGTSTTGGAGGIASVVTLNGTAKGYPNGAAGGDLGKAGKSTDIWSLYISQFYQLGGTGGLGGVSLSGSNLITIDPSSTGTLTGEVSSIY